MALKILIVPWPAELPGYVLTPAASAFLALAGGPLVEVLEIRIQADIPLLDFGELGHHRILAGRVGRVGRGAAGRGVFSRWDGVFSRRSLTHG